LVFDVGANGGQYAMGLRASGYRGAIVSFEPVEAAFTRLKSQQSGDPLWRLVPIALGRTQGTALINVAGNCAASSSLLPMLPRHIESAPDAAYIAKEPVRVETLEWALGQFKGGARRVFLKLDVQGCEGMVLEGAGDRLGEFVGVQLEASLVPLYEGEALFLELVTYLNLHGFTLMGLDPGFWDPKTGQLLQVDCIFMRPDHCVP
jgi:FkbM family methyltransferase